MSRRRPLAAAAGIAAMIAAGAAVLGTLALAAVGSTVTSEATTSVDQVTGSATPMVTGPDDPAAVRLLARAAAAAATVAYSGTAMSRSGPGTTVAAQVTGVPGLGTMVATDGAAPIMARAGATGSLADAGVALGLLAQNFQVLRAAGRDRSVGDRPALAVEVRGADGAVAARFWVDRATGLLVRRDLVDSGVVIASTWFARLSTGPQVVARHPKPAPEAWPYLLPASAVAAWRAAGCGCPAALADGMRLIEARSDSAATPGQGVLHLLYSDGLAAVSLFEQRGTLDGSARDALTDEGFQPASYAGVPVLERVQLSEGSAVPTGEWVWPTAGWVVTMVGPMPPGGSSRSLVTLVVAQAGERSATATAGGFPAAVGRGWVRVGGAVGDAWSALWAR